MNKNKFSMSFFLIIQALLALLLLVSVSYVKYATLMLFCFIDIVILFVLFKKKWGYADLFTFTTFFCSLLFLMFYLFIPGLLTYIIAIAIMLLFVISALMENKEWRETKQTRLKTFQDTIEKPSYPAYHEEHQTKVYDLNEIEQEWDREILKNTEKKVQRQKREYDKRVTDALQYELEREAFALKKAEKYTEKEKVYGEEEELQKEAKELTLAEKELEELDTLNKKYELMKEAGKLKKAEKQIEKLQKQSRQQELVTEAQKIEQAQREFDIVTKALKVKKAKTTSKSFFVSKEGTKLYHKPNCKMIAKVPKNKLNLYTSKKDASKKRLKACKSCKP